MAFLLGLGFVVSMVTPIIKVGSRVSSQIRHMKSGWRSRVPIPRGMKVKYYKGLGTSTAQR